MAQLNHFNGGLSTRIAPHLINTNEAQVYTNVDVTGVSLRPLKGDTDEAKTVAKYMFNFNDGWVSSTSYKTYVEFQEKLYYTNGSGRPQKSSDGNTWYNLGIVKPAAAPTIALDGAGPLTGTYQYCYTYYNNNDGTESQPSALSSELVTSSNRVNITLVASTDAQVTNLRLYRVGGNLSQFGLVAQFDNTLGIYRDDIADIDIPGDVLDSYNNKEAPTGLKYLTEANAMFFGAVGDKLYFSDVAYVDYWSEFYFIDFDREITGIGNTPNGLLVFTKYHTYIVTGNSPTTLSKYLLSGAQGCLLHKSIQSLSNSIIWLSSDGVCVSVGGDIQVATREKLGKLTINGPKCSAVYDDTYYLSYTNGTLILDSRFGGVISESTAKYDGLHITNDILYASIGNKLYSVGTSTSSNSLEWMSPLISEGAMTMLKNYKNIYINNTGDLTFKVYIDGQLVGTKQLNSGIEEFKLPQQERLGYTIQFQVTGTGTLREIEYKAEGRQNGR
jgi:hypothetical protein